jgi:hypothetical protein
MTTIKIDESHNLAWKEGDLWYGYAYNEDRGIFIFDDIGCELIIDMWDYLWA